MKRVFICSPYRGDVKANVALAVRMCERAVEEGCAPFAPHLMYPSFLDDAVTADRVIGMACGMMWMEACDEVWTPKDVEPTEGMKQEIAYAHVVARPIVEKDVK